MNKVVVDIKILEKTYKISCEEHEINALKKAAVLVEEQMKLILKSTRPSYDKAAILTALNLAHQINFAQRDIQEKLENVEQGIQNLHEKIEMRMPSKDEEYSSE